METAARAAAMIRSYGGIEPAIAAAANDPSQPGLRHLLRLRGACEEAAEPRLRARRLRAAAEGLDTRAERLLEAAADLAGRAAFQAAHGDAGLAVGFRRRSDGAQARAGALLDEAVGLRLEAAALEADLARAGVLAAVVG